MKEAVPESKEMGLHLHGCVLPSQARCSSRDSRISRDEDTCCSGRRTLFQSVGESCRQCQVAKMGEAEAM